METGNRESFPIQFFPEIRSSNEKFMQALENETLSVPGLSKYTRLQTKRIISWKPNGKQCSKKRWHENKIKNCHN